MPLVFFNEHPSFQFQSLESLEAFLSNIYKSEGFKKELLLNVILLSDDDLLQYNRDFLNHDYYTDIITFLIEEDEDVLEAELYISLDRVKENALTLSLSFERELLRVFIHGLLHLCSYNDKEEDEVKLMREKEDFYLKLSDVSRETLFTLS